MTSHIVCDITTALLKYDKYIEKLKHTAQAVHMQITIFISFICVHRTIEGLYLKNFKSFALLLWSTVFFALKKLYRRSGKFAVKIILRSRPTAKIKHAKNKMISE